MNKILIPVLQEAHQLVEITVIDMCLNLSLTKANTINASAEDSLKKWALGI